MQKEDGQIAHRSILARSRSDQQILADFGIRHAHVSIQTTERYLGCKQKPREAVNDTLGIEPERVA
jgi:hypothetical protein